MGAFKIEIVGVGGHGCDRKAKAGERLFGRCGRFNCPDCMAYEFVQQLRQKGMLRDGDIAQGQELRDGEEPPAGAEVYEAETLIRSEREGEHVKVTKRYWKKPHQAVFTHWPGEPSQVVDDMLKNERKQGAF
jgi:hypothetical protein